MLGQFLLYSEVNWPYASMYTLPPGPPSHPHEHVLVLPTRVPGLPQSTEIDQRPDKKFRRGSTGAPAAEEVGQEQQSLALSLPCWSGGVAGGGELIPYMV